MAQVWTRVRDKVTGHQYDVALERLPLLLERGAVEEITTGPFGGRTTGKPRPAKAQRPLGVPVPTPRPKQPPKAEPKEGESA